MKESIKAALKTEFKELGLSDNTIGRLADYIVGKGTVTKEEDIATAVKGDDVKLIAKSIQGEIDGIQKAKKKAEDDLADYKAKHPGAKSTEEDEGGNKDPDISKAIADAVKEAIAPLTEKISALESANSTKAALEGARASFFGGDYAKKYKDEADDAWERAVELNEATGSKMTAEELAAKATGYFNKAVSKKGVDTSKPFKADPPEGEEEGVTDWSGERKRLQDSGRLPKDQ